MMQMLDHHEHHSFGGADSGAEGQRPGPVDEQDSVTLAGEQHRRGEQSGTTNQA
jgi:hypothetical protein